MPDWKKVDSRTDASIFPLFLYDSGVGKNSTMHKALGVGLNGIMVHFQGARWDFFEIEGDFDKASKSLLKRLESDPLFVEKTIARTYAAGKSVLDLTGEISNADLSKKTNRQLLDYYVEYCKRMREARGPGWIAPALDLSGFLTNVLEDVLKPKLKLLGKEGQLPEYFTVLTTSSKPTVGKQQDLDVLRLAVKIRFDAGLKQLLNLPLDDVMLELSKHALLNSLLEAHTKKYCWIPCTFESPAMTKEYFVSVAFGLAKTGDPEDELKRIEQKDKALEEAKLRMERELCLSAEEKHLFNVAQEVTFFKADRKDLYFKSYFEMRPLIKEIAARLKVTPKQAMYLLEEEMQLALLEGKVNVKLLDERQKNSILLITPEKTSVLTGKEVEKALEGVRQEKVEMADVVKGKCACPGSAKGIVKLVLSPADMHKMKKGDVLVSNATDPNVVPAMKKASAIITNTGGITCHAAIVSRELGIPCVIGTRVATEVLKDGDVVEVDANAGIVKVIERFKK